MKKFVRSFAVVALPLLLVSCSKKPTTVVDSSSQGSEETTAGTAASADSPTPRGAASTEPAPGPGAPQVAPPAPGSDTGLLAGLAPEDRAKYEAWFKRYNLTDDPAVLDQDSDSDGYSNREEFLADTNPRDPKSLPGVMDEATVKAVNEVTVPLILREVKGGTAFVERTDGGGEERLTSGTQPKGLPYKVTGVKHEVKADKHGVLSDVSNVTLENTETKEKVVLIRDLPARSSETHAVLVGPTGQEKRVHLDETVEIPGLPGRQFKVIELRADQVLVEEIGTKRALAIPKR